MQLILERRIKMKLLKKISFILLVIMILYRFSHINTTRQSNKSVKKWEKIWKKYYLSSPKKSIFFLHHALRLYLSLFWEQEGTIPKRSPYVVAKPRVDCFPRWITSTHVGVINTTHQLNGSLPVHSLSGGLVRLSLSWLVTKELVAPKKRFQS